MKHATPSTIARLVALSLGCAAISMLTPAAAATAVTCQPTKVKAIVSHDIYRETNSTIFVPLTEAGGQFVQGGSRPSCVMVRFEGYIATSAANVIAISAKLDGETIAPDGMQLAHATPFYQPRTWTFIIPSVAPGVHVIRFKFRSSNGDYVSVLSTNTIIHHAP